MERRRWGGKPRCPHCDGKNVYKMRDRETGERNKRFLWRCRECAKQYTVRIGTVFEDSRIPMRHWVFAFWSAASSKKGVSAFQIRRETGLSYKSALFMMHRIRWAMRENHGRFDPIGGRGRTVEADETYVGGKPRYSKKRSKQKKTGRGTSKTPVVAMVERGGNVRMRVVERVTTHTLGKLLIENVSPDGRLMTDEWPAYKYVGGYFKEGHERVKHKNKEYVRKGSPDVHSNTVESVFSLLKRGLMGTFHSVSKKHLHRYLDEFEFRWNTREDHDGDRMAKVIRMAEGKRLIYKDRRRPAKHALRSPESHVGDATRGRRAS